MKLKFRLIKLERALVFQVLFQHSWFRASNIYLSKTFIAANGFKVETVYRPVLDHNGVALRGIKEDADFAPVTRDFKSNRDRDDYARRLLEALEDWSLRAFPIRTRPFIKMDSNDKEFVL